MHIIKKLIWTYTSYMIFTSDSVYFALYALRTLRLSASAMLLLRPMWLNYSIYGL